MIQTIRYTGGQVTVTFTSNELVKVKIDDRRAKTFKGESAWSNAQRYANDRLCEKGVMREQFVL